MGRVMGGGEADEAVRMTRRGERRSMAMKRGDQLRECRNLRHRRTKGVESEEKDRSMWKEGIGDVEKRGRKEEGGQGIHQGE